MKYFSKNKLQKKIFKNLGTKNSLVGWNRLKELKRMKGSSKNVHHIPKWSFPFQERHLSKIFIGGEFLLPDYLTCWQINLFC